MRGKDKKTVNKGQRSPSKHDIFLLSLLYLHEYFERPSFSNYSSQVTKHSICLTCSPFFVLIQPRYYQTYGEEVPFRVREQCPLSSKPEVITVSLFLHQFYRFLYLLICVANSLFCSQLFHFELYHFIPLTEGRLISQPRFFLGYSFGDSIG